MLLKVSPLIRVSSNDPSACSPSERRSTGEQDAFETLRLDQAEHQGDGGTGFTGTGRHCQQDLLLAVNNGLLYRANGILR